MNKGSPHDNESDQMSMEQRIFQVPLLLANRVVYVGPEQCDLHQYAECIPCPGKEVSSNILFTKNIYYVEFKEKNNCVIFRQISEKFPSFLDFNSSD